MNKVKLHLEDKGQDFLWFVVEVNENARDFGKIIETGPFQGIVWNGKNICMFSKVGKKPTIEIKSGDWAVLNYAVVKIEKVKE